jgi:hypothetical protein
MFFKTKSIIVAPIIIWLVLGVVQMESFAQRGNIWVFGDSSGINFNKYTLSIPFFDTLNGVFLVNIISGNSQIDNFKFVW